MLLVRRELEDGLQSLPSFASTWLRPAVPSSSILVQRMKSFSLSLFGSGTRPSRRSMHMGDVSVAVVYADVDPGQRT